MVKLLTRGYLRKLAAAFCQQIPGHLPQPNIYIDDTTATLSWRTARISVKLYSDGWWEYDSSPADRGRCHMSAETPFPMQELEEDLSYAITHRW